MPANREAVLVTGAAGFIGSHLSRRLREEGRQVIGLDNFDDYYDPETKRANLKPLEGDPGFRLIRGDVRHPEDLERAFRAGKPGAIVHLAARAGVRPSIENPALYFDVNVRGTQALLEKASREGVRSFLFASSSSVYGSNVHLPFSESDTLEKFLSPYASTKRAGELLCQAYSHCQGMRTAALRFFTVYGPGQRPDLAIHRFSRLILAGKEVPFFGDGSSGRDYTYIDDIIDGILRALSWAETKAADGACEIFNLGSDRPILLKDMVGCIEEELGVRAKLKLQPYPDSDMPCTWADLDKSQKVLGYRPAVPFREGIRRFAEWVRSTEPAIRADRRPFFSIALPAHNAERFIERAILSVKSQTFTDWELVIIDDASTDRTGEISEKLAGEDTRIRVIKNERNLNIARSLNRGIAAARGSWIARLDADDAYEDEYLERLRAEIGENPRSDFFVSTWARVIDGDDQTVLDVRLPQAETVERMIHIENFLYHAATSFPKALWWRVGGYPTGDRSVAEDTAMWRRFFAAGARLRMIPEFLIRYRIHSANITSVNDARVRVRQEDGSKGKLQRHTREWRISLLLKQGFRERSREEIYQLKSDTGSLSAKNLAYLALTYLPAGLVRLFMWSFRPRARAVARVLRGSWQRV